MAEGERPNTVAGLIAKRRELVALQATLEAELRKVVCDLDHLDAAIRLFDPQNTVAAIRRYAAKHKARKGQLQRFVLGHLRGPPNGRRPRARSRRRGWRRAVCG